MNYALILDRLKHLCFVERELYRYDIPLVGYKILRKKQ